MSKAEKFISDCTRNCSNQYDLPKYFENGIERLKEYQPWISPDQARRAVEIAKEVVDCGLWYLAEYEDGQFTLNHKPKEFTDVGAYLKKQGRFRHLTDDDIQIITASRNKKWDFIDKNFEL